MNRGVFLSAGHDSTSVGSSANGYTEIELTVLLRDNLAFELRKRDCYVLCDGGAGMNLSLSRAISLAKTVEGPRIELHTNIGPPQASGVEAFSTLSRRSLASNLAIIVGQALDIPIRGKFGWKLDSTSQHSRLAFCREAGGVVLELFYLSNLRDLKQFLNNRQKLIDNLVNFLLSSTLL